jgi:hypothetical protein
MKPLESAFLEALHDDPADEAGRRPWAATRPAPYARDCRCARRCQSRDGYRVNRCFGFRVVMTEEKDEG